MSVAIVVVSSVTAASPREGGRRRRAPAATSAASGTAAGRRWRRIAVPRVHQAVALDARQKHAPAAFVRVHVPHIEASRQILGAVLNAPRVRRGVRGAAEVQPVQVVCPRPTVAEVRARRCPPSHGELAPESAVGAGGDNAFAAPKLATKQPAGEGRGAVAAQRTRGRRHRIPHVARRSWGGGSRRRRRRAGQLHSLPAPQPGRLRGSQVRTRFVAEDTMHRRATCSSEPCPAPCPAAGDRPRRPRHAHSSRGDARSGLHRRRARHPAAGSLCGQRQSARALPRDLPVPTRAPVAWAQELHARQRAQGRAQGVELGTRQHRQLRAPVAVLDKHRNTKVRRRR